MPNPVPICTHIKTDGIRCGSPAVSGTELCYHHSAIKTATGHAVFGGSVGDGGFAPIPFIFPEDRASMQINFFLLLQAFNQHQIDLRTFKSMMSLLKAMKSNLGRSGSLVEEASDQRSAGGDQKNSVQRAAGSDQASEKSVSKGVAVELSAAWEALPIPVAPESCFLKDPTFHAEDLFRMSPVAR